MIDDDDDRFESFWGRLLNVAIPLPEQRDDDMLAEMIETTAKELLDEWIDLIFDTNKKLRLTDWRYKIILEGSGIFDKK